jgi:hypothetical protein
MEEGRDMIEVRHARTPLHWDIAVEIVHIPLQLGVRVRHDLNSKLWTINVVQFIGSDGYSYADSKEFFKKPSEKDTEEIVEQMLSLFSTVIKGG